MRANITLCLKSFELESIRVRKLKPTRSIEITACTFETYHKHSRSNSVLDHPPQSSVWAGVSGDGKRTGKETVKANDIEKRKSNLRPTHPSCVSRRSTSRYPEIRLAFPSQVVFFEKLISLSLFPPPHESQRFFCDLQESGWFRLSI